MYVSIYFHIELFDSSHKKEKKEQEKYCSQTDALVVFIDDDKETVTRPL